MVGDDNARRAGDARVDTLLGVDITRDSLPQHNATTQLEHQSISLPFISYATLHAPITHAVAMLNRTVENHEPPTLFYKYTEIEMREMRRFES